MPTRTSYNAGWSTARTGGAALTAPIHWWSASGAQVCGDGTNRYNGNKLDTDPPVTRVCPGCYGTLSAAAEDLHIALPDLLDRLRA